MHNRTNGVFGSTYSGGYDSSSSSGTDNTVVTELKQSPVPPLSLEELRKSSSQLFPPVSPSLVVEAEKSQRRCAPTCVIC